MEISCHIHTVAILFILKHVFSVLVQTTRLQALDTDNSEPSIKAKTTEETICLRHV
jgi:hypothetical protein